ncbi:MAG: hypothetical protein ACREFX_00550 [Opitutaceae bacterium]
MNAPLSVRSASDAGPQMPDGLAKKRAPITGADFAVARAADSIASVVLAIVGGVPIGA